jgi:protocatechuate 3,4-dioxygenase beta subunit
MTVSRRRLLQVAGGTAGVVGAAGVISLWLERLETPMAYRFPDASGASTVLAPTAACGDTTETPSQIEGPYYTPDTPLRTVLREPATVGMPLVIEGRVLTTSCRPIAGVVLDVWSCDGNGLYDNDGFRLRGHQFTDSQGRFYIETVKPADYGGFLLRRTPHVHLKVQGRDTPLLTTQLYFPGESLNREDPNFDERLVMKVENAGPGALHAAFDFVLVTLSAHPSASGGI